MWGMGKVKDNNTSKGKTLNILLLIGIPLITVLVIVSATKFFDNNKVDEIKSDLNDAEYMLEDFLSNEDSLPASVNAYLIDDIETKTLGKTVFNSNEIVKNVDLNKNYYRIPGIISAIIDFKLKGDFIWDNTGRVYYIHYRKLNLKVQGS